MQDALWEKQITIRKKDDTIRQREITIREKEDIIREKEDTIRQNEDIIREKENVIRCKENTIREKEDCIWKKETYIREQEDAIKEKQEESKEMQAVIYEMAVDIESYQEVINTGKADTERANCDIQQLKEDLAKKDDEVKSLKKLQEDVNEKVVELLKENKGLKSQVLRVNGKMAELQSENKELKSQVKNVTDQMVGLQNETKALKSNVQRMEAIITEKTADIESYLEVIDKHTEDIERTNIEKVQLEQDVKTRENEIKSLTEVCKFNQEEARKQAEESHRKVKQLIQELTKQDNEIKSYKEASKFIAKDVTKLEQEKDQLKETLGDRMKKILIYQNKIADLESENERKNESLKVFKKKMAEDKKENEKTIKDLQKRREILNKDLQKEKERHKNHFEAKYKFEDENTKLKKENRRLSSFEKAYYAVEKQIIDTELEISKQLRTIQSQEKTTQSLLSEINWYRNENDTKTQMIIGLEDEKESLLLRLSKIPDAQLKYANPNIADLSDQKRPSKLAEEFNELYDNEWTDAFGCTEGEGDDEKTQALYELLKRSYEFCDTLSTRHYEAIIKSFTTLNYSMKFLKQNIDVKNSNMLSDRQDITDEVRTSANKENDNMDQTVQNYRQCSVKNTARSKPPCEKQYTEAGVPVDTKELLIAERECVEKRNYPPEVKVSELMFYSGDFSAEQRNTILDLRKLCEEKQANDVVQVGSKLIAAEMQIENGEIMTYISKCIDICWSMCRHTPPVYIDFSKRAKGLPFNKQLHRPYTKSGKFVHFVVWPVLYLHEGGPQLSKGVAQGKD